MIVVKQFEWIIQIEDRGGLCGEMCDDDDDDDDDVDCSFSVVCVALCAACCWSGCGTCLVSNSVTRKNDKISKALIQWHKYGVSREHHTRITCGDKGDIDRGFNYVADTDREPKQHNSPVL